MLLHSRYFAFAGLFLVAATACGDDGGGADAAPEADAPPMIDAAEGAVVSPLTGSFLEGTATFIPVETGGATLQISVEAPEGEHGIRLHLGDCTEHGDVWEHGVVGDMTIVGEGGHLGHGTADFSNDQWTVDDGAETDVVGKALVLYGGPGESNGVMGCGIIGE